MYKQHNEYKKVILTGANGFIGRYLVDELTNHNIFVYAVVRSLNNISDQLTNNKNVKIIECDINNINRLPLLINDDNIDIFYHLAWNGVSGPTRYDYVKQLKNISNSIKLANILTKWKIKKFIGAGSIHEIECINKLHNIDLSNINCDAYEISKLYTRLAIKNILKEYNIKFFWPIIINAFGIGEVSNRLIYTTIKEMMLNKTPMLMTNGNQIYDFLYVSDVAKAFYLIGEYGIEGKEYIINSGLKKTLKYYMYLLKDIVNPNLDINFGNKNGISIFSDTTNLLNLREDTGFIPSITFEEGIKKLVKWFKKTQI